MIITVKNLQQQTFKIDFDPEKKVLALKEKIFQECGSEYVVDKQKLIYAGIVLDNECTIASYNVDEQKFVVVMLKRDLGSATQKPDETGVSNASSDASITSTSSSDSNNADGGGGAHQQQSCTEKSAEGSSKFNGDGDANSVGSGGSDSSGGGDGVGGGFLGSVGSSTSVLSNASGISLQSSSSVDSSSSETSHSTYSSGDLDGVFSNTSLQSHAESNLLMGEEYSRSVESMIEMGYCREMVERAMAASFNNPERAVEYLISGIPETEDGFSATSATGDESNAILCCDSDEQLVVDDDTDTGDGDSDAIGADGDSTLCNRRFVDNEVTGNLNAVGAGGDGVNDADAIGVPVPAATANRHASDDDAGGNGIDGDDDNYGAGIIYGPFLETEGAALGDQLNLHGDNASTADALFDNNPFEFLRHQPQFLQMRALVYHNPELLHAVLQQIGQTNPALLQLISENQDAFLGMLNQPIEGHNGAGGSHYQRRMTPGRRAQLAAAARAAAGGDGLHIRALDTAPGAGGDGPPPRQRPGESGDAGADTIPHDLLPPRPDRAAERRAAAADAFMRERAAAAATVAAITAAASAAVERDAGAGEGGGDILVPTGATVVGSDDNVGVATIRLTPQEQDAIERLKALGFPETLVLQAYFACDKDEQLTANLLISSAIND